MSKVFIQSDDLTTVIDFRDIADTFEHDNSEGEPWFSGKCSRCNQEVTDRGNREDSLEACELHVDRCDGSGRVS